MVEVLYKSPATIQVSEKTIQYRCTPLLVLSICGLKFSIQNLNLLQYLLGSVHFGVHT